MRRIALFLLFITGAAEIYYVAFVVNFTIYTNEQSIAKTVGIAAVSSEKQKAYWEFYEHLGDQWNAVALFGIATLALALVLTLATRPATYESDPRIKKSSAEHVVGGNRR